MRTERSAGETRAALGATVRADHTGPHKWKDCAEGMDGTVDDYHWMNDTGPEEWFGAARECEAESAGRKRGWECTGTWRDDDFFWGAHGAAEAGEWGAGEDVYGGESAVNVFGSAGNVFPCSAAELPAAAEQCCPAAARSTTAACVAVGPAPPAHAGLGSEAVREPRHMIKELVHRVILDEYKQQICCRGPGASWPDADRKRLKDHLKQVSLAAMEDMLGAYGTLMSSPSEGATLEHILSGSMAIAFAQHASAQLAPDLVWITRHPEIQQTENRDGN